MGTFIFNVHRFVCTPSPHARSASQILDRPERNKSKHSENIKMVRPVVLVSLVAAPLASAQLLSDITSVFGDVTSGVVSVATDLASNAESVATSVATEVTSGAGGVFSTVTSGADGVFSTITSGADGTFGTVTSGADGLLSSATSAIDSAASDIGAAGTDSDSGSLPTGVPVAGAMIGLGAAALALL